MNLSKRLGAEFIGTFWLVFGGCGSAIFAAGLAGVGIGYLGVSLAFGLTVLTMVYAVGGISGGHFNPAVSLGLWAGGRFSGKDLLPYIIVQVLGAIAASALLYLIVNGSPDFIAKLGSPDSADKARLLASNGYGDNSPHGYPYLAGLAAEIVLTFIFLFVILGATDKRAPKGFAGIAIGLTLTLIHLVSIPITNTSVNPARSTGPALIEAMIGEVASLTQVWFFWVMPIIGAILAGVVYKWFESKGEEAAE